MDSLKNFLTEVADEIRVKRGIEDKIVANNFASEIGSIEVAEGPVSKDVDFIDYDGTLLYSYTLAEIQNMTELPPLPTQPGLICQEWNWSLEDIKAFGRRLIVGATYITDDGKTRIYIDLTSEERLEMSLLFRQSVSNGVELDWGDGSPVETFNKSGNANIQPTHHYANIGKYIITFNPIDECVLTIADSGMSANITGSLSSGVRDGYYYSNTIFRVEIGKNIHTLGKYAFTECRNLINVTIPNNVITMSDGIFDECNSLVYVTIPNGVTAINTETFYMCASILGISIPKGIVSIGKNAFYYCYSLSEIILPSEVINASGVGIFSGCFSLRKIIIPNNVTVIANSMFSGCYNLQEIIIPDGVTSIGYSAFNYCYRLRKIILPDSIISIGNNAFNACYNLQEITIPDGVTSMGQSVFSGSKKLQKITIPSSVTSIDSSSFSGCHSLNKVTILNGVTSIGSNAFNNCYSIPEWVIPNSVVNIEASAFTANHSVKKYDFSTHTQIPTIANVNVFNSIPSDCQIIVPDALYEEWIAATNWSNYADYIIKVSELETME